MSFEWLSPHKKDRKDPYYNRPNGIPSVRPLTATFALLAFGEGAKPTSVQGALAPRGYVPQYEVDRIFVAEGSTIPPHPQANCICRKKTRQFLVRVAIGITILALVLVLWE